MQVVIAGDFLCGPWIYWRLRSRLGRQGFHVYQTSARSIFKNLERHSRELSVYLEKWDIRGAVLIGHGVGGLAALALPDAARRRIRHLVTVGTAFQGSRLMLPLKAFPALGDMAVGSQYLLINRMNALLFPHITPFSAWQDELILPFNLSRFGQGRDLILDQVGHYNLVLGGENVTTIVESTLASDPELAAAAADEGPEQQEDGSGVQASGGRQATKRTTKKVAKKAARRPAKKVAKKATKKATKRTAKKVTKKTGRRR